jgi:hypothetical protein
MFLCPMIPGHGSSHGELLREGPEDPKLQLQQYKRELFRALVHGLPRVASDAMVRAILLFVGPARGWNGLATERATEPINPSPNELDVWCLRSSQEPSPAQLNADVELWLSLPRVCFSVFLLRGGDGIDSCCLLDRVAVTSTAPYARIVCHASFSAV